MVEDDAYATIASGGGTIFGGRIVKVGLLFVVQILIARILGTSAYGSVVLAGTVIGIGSLLGNLGMPRGLIRNIPHYEDSPAEARGILQAGVVSATLGGLLFGGLIFVAAPTIATVVFNDSSLTDLFRIAAVAVPLSVLTQTGVSIARAARTAKPQVIVNHFLSPIARALFVGGLVVAGYGAAGAITGVVFVQITAAAAAGVLAYRTLSVTLRGPATPKYREMLMFSLPLVMAAGIDFLVVNTDTFLIGTFLTPARVGIYNSAFRLRTAGLFFFHPLTYLLPPVLTRLAAESKMTEARRTYQLVSKWTILLTTPLFLAVLLFPEVAIQLSFGSNYLAASLPLRTLMLPVMVTVLLGANEKALVALGHNRISLYVNGIVVAINIVLNVLLIPQIGIAGAAVASATAFITRDLLFSTALYRHEGLHPFSSAMLRPYLMVLALSAVGYLAFIRLFPVTVLSVVAVGIVFLVLYAPAVVLLGGIEAEDERLLSLLEDRTDVEFSRLRGAVRRLQSRSCVD